MGALTVAWIVAETPEATPASAVVQPIAFAIASPLPEMPLWLLYLEVGCVSLESFEFSYCCHSCYCLLLSSQSYYLSLTFTDVGSPCFLRGSLPAYRCLCSLDPAQSAWLQSRWRLKFNTHLREAWQVLGRQVDACLPRGRYAFTISTRALWGWRQSWLGPHLEKPQANPEFWSFVLGKQTRPLTVFTGRVHFYIHFRCFLSVFLNDPMGGQLSLTVFQMYVNISPLLDFSWGELWYFVGSLFSEVKYTGYGSSTSSCIGLSRSLGICQ